MSNWNHLDEVNENSQVSCSSDTDWKDAVQIASQLDIPLTHLSLERDYLYHVFDPYVQALWQTGRMGNPDVDCNTHVKFGALFRHLSDIYGTNVQLATGHYARLWHRQHNSKALPESVEKAASSGHESTLDWLRTWGNNTNRGDPSTLLLAGADGTKDQSYVLSGCNADAFRHVSFPLGDLCKSSSVASHTDASLSHVSVRDLAQRYDIPVATKRDSMGLCFVGKRPSGFASFCFRVFAAPTPDVMLARPVSHSTHVTPGRLYRYVIQSDHGQYHIDFHAVKRGIVRGRVSAVYTVNGLVCLGSGPIAAGGPSHWQAGRRLPDATDGMLRAMISGSGIIGGSAVRHAALLQSCFDGPEKMSQPILARRDQQKLRIPDLSAAKGTQNINMASYAFITLLRSIVILPFPALPDTLECHSVSCVQACLRAAVRHYQSGRNTVEWLLVQASSNSAEIHDPSVADGHDSSYREEQLQPDIAVCYRHPSRLLPQT